MSKWVKILIAGAAVVWSLLAWGVYALVAALGDFLARNADWATGHPETVVWLAWLSHAATSLGLFGVVVVWLIGLAAIGLAMPLLSVLKRRVEDFRP